ncbi:hypothetical protein SEA_BAJUNIPER_47 [Microbacterium phage BAjuniper]|nr:hypothetical protein SEA_BAJUNIPER_47 [Microbacterium phage BAjuniper]
MMAHFYPDSHFMAVGKRVQSSWSFEEGTVVPCPDIQTGEVLVEWDNGIKTLCWPPDLEPAD